MRLALLFWGIGVFGCLSQLDAKDLHLKETDSVIVISQGDQPILTYNKVSPPVPDGIREVYRRSGCIHPVASPAGRTVTTMFPFDHPHQHGIFTAWVRTTYDGRAIDFWNLAGGTGRVLHEDVIETFNKKEQVGFEVTLLHRAEGDVPIDVLREHWRVTAKPTDGTHYCFDLETRQEALTNKPLMIEKYHYGGVVLRGPTRWLTAQDREVGKSDSMLEPSDFLNNLGSARQAGNHQRAKWVALWGEIDGQPVSIAVLSHRENFRAPQAARLHPSKPYFCFAPCVGSGFAITKDQPFRSRYRYLVADTMPNASWLDEQWETWCTSE